MMERSPATAATAGLVGRCVAILTGWSRDNVVPHRALPAETRKSLGFLCSRLYPLLLTLLRLIATGWELRQREIGGKGKYLKAVRPPGMFSMLSFVLLKFMNFSALCDAVRWWALPRCPRVPPGRPAQACLGKDPYAGSSIDTCPHANNAWLILGWSFWTRWTSHRGRPSIPGAGKQMLALSLSLGFHERTLVYRKIYVITMNLVMNSIRVGNMIKEMILSLNSSIFFQIKSFLYVTHMK